MYIKIDKIFVFFLHLDCMDSLDITGIWIIIFGLNWQTMIPSLSKNYLIHWLVLGLVHILRQTKRKYYSQYREEGHDQRKSTNHCHI